MEVHAWRSIQLTVLILAVGLASCCLQDNPPNCDNFKDDGRSYHEHDINCSKYYLCENGNMYELECEPGQYFNRLTEACETTDNYICSSCNNFGYEKAPCTPIPTCNSTTVGFLLPVPDNCTLYVYCTLSGTGSIRKCPNGYEFNPELKRCMLASDAHCIPCSNEVLTTTPSICPAPETCQGKAEGTVLPYPTNCSQYIYCLANGASSIRKCFKGYEFDPILTRCVIASQSTCKDCVVAITETTPVNCALIPSCSASNVGSIYPYADDCSKYIYCTEFQTAEIRTCYKGQLFSASKNRCVDAAVADCFTCEVTTTEMLTTENQCPAHECSMADVGTVHPYPTNCSLYIYCSESGSGQIRVCYNGYLFSVSLNRCVNKAVVDCFQCETTTIESTTLVSTTTEVQQCPAHVCNATDTGHVYPYPSDCSKYIYCDDKGKGMVRVCPPGEFYSASQSRCVSEAQADCYVCPETSTTDESTTEITTPGVCSPIETCTLSEVGVFKPYSLNCSVYIYCNILGETEIRSCPEGMQFSPTDLYCMPPDEAMCPLCYESTTTELISTTTLDPCALPTCTLSEFGQTKPHPKNCSLYIYCTSDGSTEIRICPNGLEYSPELFRCTDPSQSQCQLCEITTTESTTELTTIGVCAEVPECSLADAGVSKPYPPDCSQYIYCNALGEAENRTCYNGLEFSPTELYCMEPELANCPPCVLSTSTTLEQTSTTEMTTLDPCPVPTCSLFEEGVTKPHPKNCSLYIYCTSNGSTEIRICPNGLEYSPELFRCTDPSQSQCQLCDVTTTTEMITTTESTTELTTLGVCAEIPECSLADAGVSKPYPPDCSQYIYCNALGEAENRTCYNGLEFSPTELYCMEPELANCPPCVLSTSTTLESTSTTEMTTLDPCPVPTCSLFEWGDTKPHPKNCSLYIYCTFDGDSEIRICPAGQEYSPTMLRCTSPAESGCVICGLTTTAEPSTTESSTVSSTVATTVAICPPVEECSIAEAGVSKPYPPDCTTYIYCNDLGETEYRTCYTGLHFSPTELYCVEPEVAGCPYCIEGSTTEEVSTTTEDPCPIPTCTLYEWGESKPHPKNCSSYIYCSEFGETEIRYCPPGLHYNPTTKNCTEPSLANCQLCGVTTTSENPTTESSTIAVCPYVKDCSLAEAGMSKPYPPDCTKYIYCNDLGEAEYRSCFTGLHFSPVELFCTDPAEANCPYCIELSTTEMPTTTTSTPPPTTTTSTPPTTTTSTPPPTTTTSTPPTTTTSTPPPTTTTSTPPTTTTSTPPPTTTTTLPPTTTTSTPPPTTTTTLPPTTTTSTPPPTTTTTLPPTTTTSTPPPTTTTTTAPPSCLIPTCSINDLVGATKPYPPDCEKYIYCNSAHNAEVRYCPIGKHYSPSLRKCEIITLAGCTPCVPATTAKPPAEPSPLEKSSKTGQHRVE